MCQIDTYIMSGGAYKNKEKYIMCVHNNSLDSQPAKKNTKLWPKKKSLAHSQTFRDVCHVIQRQSAAFDAVTVLLSVVPSPALHWTQPLLRRHTNCSEVALGLGCFTWTPYIFKCLKMILTSSFRLDY